MNSQNVNDSQSRELALNPTKSYIVQAPAGSGKTELLTQRVLNLLSHVSKPEEIIALTFTKKAAAEMRERVIESLQSAMSGEPAEPHKLITFKLAKQVLNSDVKYNWGLLNNPARLNITTIDSLCAKIVKQTPVISQLGGDMTITSEPLVYYQQAVSEVFNLINTEQYNKDCNWTNDLKILLQHFSSNYKKLQNFLLAMLYKRDQWLPYVVNSTEDNLHDLMQFCWQELANDVISEITNIIPLNIKSELSELLVYAASNLKDLGQANLAQNTILNHGDNNLIYWQAISQLLFAASGGSKLKFRKRLDKRTGFNSKSDFKIKEQQLRAVEHKDKLLNIITDLNTGDNQELLDLFALIRQLPTFDYSKDNWQLLVILSRILTLLEAQLRIVFKSNKLIDFSGVAQSALYALGDDDNPSDLGLYFDYSIKHILVDEFQDTSYTQYKLLYKLTSTWDTQEETNKTLFLVGDPQQSIYRFRQAEVGLFLQVKQSGIGNIKLDFIALNKNFRSEQQIVNWVNQKFTNIFPKSSNILFGAVSYDNSIATKSNNPSLSPVLKLFDKSENNNSQNSYIIKKIKSLINPSINSNNTGSNISIAVLVRNRSKVLGLISELKDNNININAVDIELLADKMVVKDLLSLTTAILDLSDRCAWLSILRAPWCGLTLEELYVLTFGNNDKTVWDCICSFTESKEDGSAVSNNSKAHKDLALKINNIILVLSNVFEKIYKLNFHRIIEQAWYGLGGNVIYSTKQELLDAKQFFDLIFSLEQSNLILNIDDLSREVNKLFASANVFLPEFDKDFNSDNNTSSDKISHNNYSLDIMTIHKSKGLQFDYVFLPYLDSISKVNEHQMLSWQAYHNNNINGILLAPYHIKKNDQIKFYDTLRFIEQYKENYELSRLFYVAITRTIKSCILTASLKQENLDLISDSVNNNLIINRSDVKISPRSLLGQFIEYLEPNEIEVIASSNTVDSINKVSSKENCNQISDINTKKIRYLDYNNYQLANIIKSNDTDYNKYLINKTADLFTKPAITDNPSEYLLEDESLRIIGIFVHKIFYNIAIGIINMDDILINNNINPNLIENWKNLLLNQGISLDYINQAIGIVGNAVKNTLLDITGKWILADHKISFAEKIVYYKSKNKLNMSIIDRVFIDNNSIWVVDYKITEDNDANIDQYKKQLEHYGYLVKQLFAKEVAQHNYKLKLGLYYPLISDFISWEIGCQSHVKTN